MDWGFSTLLNTADPNFAKIHALKAVLSQDSFCLAAMEGDVVTILTVAAAKIDQLYPAERGATLLIFAICFDQYEVAEALLSKNASPDTPDTIVHFTPLMWAVYFNQLDMVKLLFEYQADPYLLPQENGKNAISILGDGPIHDYFRDHNLLNHAHDADSTFHTESSFDAPYEVDDLANRIKLQTIDVHAEAPKEHVEEDDETELRKDHLLVQLKEFEYDKLSHEEYIKYGDADIPELLDFIFGLRGAKYQHNTRIPATLVFQLLRYSALKTENRELTEFMFDCFLTRLRSVTGTTSGVFFESQGDIVLLSYWVSVLVFLHWYLTKQELYKAYPQFLEELLNVVQSLVSSLSFSINSRLNEVVDDCILDYTNLVDVSNVLYAKDWNLFKSKKHSHNTFEDIYDMLYPPSQKELMKPSPLKYIQTLGALDYVLELHSVHRLVRAQCYAQVFYYMNAVIFNKIILQSKYLSRVKAIQIRLNLSAIEDWLRSHSSRDAAPEVIGGLERLAPENYTLKNVLQGEQLAFCYKSNYFIGKKQLQPTIELLQFLQCMSSLSDEETFINTLNQFDCLNYYQVLKVIKAYKYEVDEPKLPKKLVSLTKALVLEQGEKQVERSGLTYLVQNKLLSKEIYVYINPNHVYPPALPNYAELVGLYGAGLGGVKILRAKRFQPSLPIDVLDDVDELLKDEFQDTQDTQDFDEQYGEVQAPLSLAHREWELEENPW